MKKIINVLSFALTLTLCFGLLPISGLQTAEGVASTDSLKILAIGNSFSEDATEYIPMIARDLGIKNITVGNMYIGGCTIEKHASNARNNEAAYKYYKNTSFSLMSVAPSTKNVALDTALRDEKWDVVTLQNSSVHSGQKSKYNKDVDYLVEYIKERCPEAKIAWHMTWAYETGYTGSAFSTYYRKNEMFMYNSIVNCVKGYIVPHEGFDFIIPAGTAIQNARTSFLGDKLTRDGLHLTIDYGRYIVAATWMKSLGYSLDGLKTMPNRMRSRVLPFIKECVDNAFAAPFEVTQSAYWYEPGTAPPATTPVTEAATAPEVTDVPETQPPATVEATPSETDDLAQIMPAKGYSGVIITVVCVVCVAAIAAVGIVFAKKKKK